mgnify:CR=1 FL=1
MASSMLGTSSTRAGIKIPFFERLDKLYLGQMTVDIKTEQSVPTNDFNNVNVDAVAKVRISPERSAPCGRGGFSRSGPPPPAPGTGPLPGPPDL